METPEAHRTQRERNETFVCFKFSDKFCVEKHDSLNNTLLQPPTFHSLSLLFLHVKCISASFLNQSNSTSFLCGTLTHLQLHLSDFARLGRNTGVLVLTFTPQTPFSYHVSFLPSVAAIL